MLAGLPSVINVCPYCDIRQSYCVFDLVIIGGATPLIVAVSLGHDEIEQFLISNGAITDEKYKVSIEL